MKNTNALTLLFYHYYNVILDLNDRKLFLENINFIR